MQDSSATSIPAPFPSLQDMQAAFPMYQQYLAAQGVSLDANKSIPIPQPPQPQIDQSGMMSLFAQQYAAANNPQVPNNSVPNNSVTSVTQAMDSVQIGESAAPPPSNKSVTKKKKKGGSRSKKAKKSKVLNQSKGIVKDKIMRNLSVPSIPRKHIISLMGIDEKNVIAKKEGEESKVRERTDKKIYNESKLLLAQFDKKRLEQKPEEHKPKPVEKMEIQKCENVIDPLNPYEKIIINTNEVDEDIQCDICLEYDHDDEDQIVICDLCNAATHQSCYGGPLTNQVPQGNWYCDRCSVLNIDKNRKCTEIKCFLCPDIDGLMKCVDPLNQLWAHVICVNYNPDINFKNNDKTVIEGQLNKQRFALSCGKCKHDLLKSNIGACIQCDQSGCTKSYHVRCAVKIGMIQDWDTIEKLVGEDLEKIDQSIPFFCKMHRNNGYTLFKKSLTENPEEQKVQNRGGPKKRKGKNIVEEGKVTKIKQSTVPQIIDFSKLEAVNEIKEIQQGKKEKKPIAKGKTKAKSLRLVAKKKPVVKSSEKVKRKPEQSQKETEQLKKKSIKKNAKSKQIKKKVVSKPAPKVVSPKKVSEPQIKIQKKPIAKPVIAKRVAAPQKAVAQSIVKKQPPPTPSKKQEESKTMFEASNQVATDPAQMYKMFTQMFQHMTGMPAAHTQQQQPLPTPVAVPVKQSEPAKKKAAPKKKKAGNTELRIDQDIVMKDQSSKQNPLPLLPPALQHLFPNAPQNNGQVQYQQYLQSQNLAQPKPAIQATASKKRAKSQSKAAPANKPQAVQPQEAQKASINESLTNMNTMDLIFKNKDFMQQLGMVTQSEFKPPSVDSIGTGQSLPQFTLPWRR
ncbi:hypothetical protein FGO68_gene6208 [Halteria grandinella]|uniref:Uncharacterized protein n=1 Tax=Halteria grandinella TaxID=5974 RepID=A0A8J8T7R0_HALGN|nr:hypothetical protein FGO68_gene6208 [Halteria grandinella]